MNFFDVVIRLVVACVLGGVIGYERESTHRPAGFRTHILVSIGATLVMITGEVIVHQYKGIVNSDPSRLGAQVITGVGFLGAGTIIREGFNVKGLTTAASLWAVSCVGLAVGIGFFEGAVVATALIYITLITLKRMETHIARKNRFRVLYIQGANTSGFTGDVSRILEAHHVKIKSIEFDLHEKTGHTILKLLVKIPEESHLEYVGELQQLKDVQKVIEE